MTNTYSGAWFDTFLSSYPPETTRVEAMFVERWLPVQVFPSILDLCCGLGRHAALLAAKGYAILGVDRDEAAIQRARAACPRATFEVRDMRDMHGLPTSFDGVINLWHSFGYFDDRTNLAILNHVHSRLRKGGRALFDIYNRSHFAERPLIEESERAGRRIRTTRSWTGDRHKVVVEYDGAPGDVFEWRLYEPDEFREMCRAVGLASIIECAWFDETRSISAEHARMQFLLERV